MRGVIAALGLLTLAACGADGEPLTPVARADISLSESGVYSSTELGLRNGSLAIWLGF